MMRRLLLLPGLLLCFGTLPASAEEMVKVEFECVSGKLQATLGQAFNLNVVPKEDDDSDGTVVVDEAEIIRSAEPGPFGPPAQTLAEGSGPATADLPFQIATLQIFDTGVEAYGRAEFFVIKPKCPGGLAGITCALNQARVPAVAVFRLDNQPPSGTESAIPMHCEFDEIESLEP